MKKAHYNALEKVYANEIAQAMSNARIRFPFQSRAKVFRELADMGLLRQSSVQIEPGCTVLGWDLTHAGRYAYGCECVGESLKDAA